MCPPCLDHVGHAGVGQVLEILLRDMGSMSMQVGGGGGGMGPHRLVYLVDGRHAKLGGACHRSWMAQWRCLGNLAFVGVRFLSIVESHDSKLEGRGL